MPIKLLEIFINQQNIYQRNIRSFFKFELIRLISYKTKQSLKCSMYKTIIINDTWQLILLLNSIYINKYEDFSFKKSYRSYSNIIESN